MKIKHSKCIKTLYNLLKHVMHSSKIYLQNRKIQIRTIKKSTFVHNLQSISKLDRTLNSCRKLQKYWLLSYSWKSGDDTGEFFFPPLFLSFFFSFILLSFISYLLPSLFFLPDLKKKKSPKQCISQYVKMDTILLDLKDHC